MRVIVLLLPSFSRISSSWARLMMPIHNPRGTASCCVTGLLIVQSVHPDVVGATPGLPPENILQGLICLVLQMVHCRGDDGTQSIQIF